MKNYSSAIVGCGAISGVHAAAVSKAGARLAAVCDIKPERAACLAEKTGARAYASFEEMLEKEKIDVLHICTPHFLHLPMAKTALERGIHTVLEKPPAMNEGEFLKLSRTESASSASLCVCFQNRLNATTAHALSIVNSGEYGELLGARGIVTWCRRGGYYTDSSWRGRYETEGGGVLINQAIHTLDLLNYFLGKPTSVRSLCANMSHPETETEDTVCAEINYGDKNAVFYATVSNCASPEAKITLFLKHASIELGSHECILRPEHGGAIVYDVSEKAPGKVCWGNSHSELIGRFYQSLEGGDNPCPLESCRDTMRILTAVYSGGLKATERKDLI